MSKKAYFLKNAKIAAA